MREINTSKFKATCLAVLAEVDRSPVPVGMTRLGKPIAEIVPPTATPPKESWLGSMRGTVEGTSDIVGPIGAFKVESGTEAP